ncbi:MAG: M20/M25/M40 family metallo-hydrolase [Bacteroidota bacterium]|nr:M20/M25/M40 family metallo-hydrolase [Bacteroidota bacterium]
MKNILLFIILVSQFAAGQKLTKSDKIIIDNLKSEITYLASDQLEGRRTGTPGEKLAYEYLSDQFTKAGLIPRGDEKSFIQSFKVNEGKQILSSTHLIINDDSLVLEKDFFPFIFSNNGEIMAYASPSISEKGMPWFWDLNEILEENNNNPHFDLIEAIRNKAVECEEKEASAFIIYNSGPKDDELKFEGKSKINAVKIPVIFINKEAAKKYFSDKSANLDIKIQVALGNKKRTGHNVIGYIDNGDAHTIIIGAHYDHLGYGEDHNSLWTGTPEIHHGADDNASGTATMLELAKLLKSSKLKNNNYLLISFSGEELGLLGSKYFTEHPTIKLDDVDYMINCDMVGRLNDSTQTLIIGGFGTSPSWKNLLPEKTKALSVKFDSSGIGPSDHTSFYLKNIPVLFFFTGTHKDYHKPTDVVEKINFTGELRIIQYIFNIISETNKIDKITFSKTREPQINAAHFTVTLGIMPDYDFAGNGVRANAIIDGKIAERAGMVAGDIITKLGSFKVTDLNSYMFALSKFKKGDATKVTVSRGKEEKTFDIIF